MTHQQGMLWAFTAWAQPGVSSREFEDYWSTVSWGRYGGGQCEISPNPGSDNDNPLHFQGFVLFDRNHRFNKVVAENVADASFSKPVSWRLATGTLEANEKYCSKEDTRAPGCAPIHWGSRPERRGQGKRTDLDGASDLIRSTPGNVAKKMRAVATTFPSVYVKFHKGLEALAEQMVQVEIPAPEEEQLYPWQRSLRDLLMQPPNDRTINYVYDPEGNNGKSALIRFFMKNYFDDSIVMDGKVADMSYGYKGQKYVFIDVPRSNADPLTGQKWTPDHLYHFAEKLKNGFFFSGKFSSGQKTFPIPHVTFMSNSPPVEGLWTADRLNLISISEPNANFVFPHNV